MKILSNNGKALTNNGKRLFNALRYVPVCYYGIVQDRTAQLDFNALEQILGPVGDRVTFDFASDVGYLVCVLPAATKKRTWWTTRPNNKGPVGGSPDGPLSNLFPDPVMVSHSGALFQVYVSSYQTRLHDPVTLIA